MRIEHFIIGMVIFFMVITTGFLIFGSMISNYEIPNANENTTFSGKLRNLSESHFSQEAVRGDTQLKDISAEDTESSMYKSIVPAILNIFLTAKVTGEVLEEAALETKIVEPYVIDTFITILVVLAAVFGLYMIARFKPQNN